MTLKQITDIINSIAGKQPAVNDILDSGDIFDLNSNMAAKYATFALVQQQHNETETDIQYNFYLYYVDRLKADRSNRIQIQSTGMQVLSNILRTLRDEWDMEVGLITYQTFTQRFSDECAGAYASVTITSDAGDTCADLY